MPLSEGATRARHARRLLQRVLDFAPDGTAIHPIVRIGRHAAEGIVEASAEQEADLIIFGWGGKSPAGRDGAGPRSSRRRSTRSSATRPPTSRSSSSAAPRRSGGSSSRSAADPTPSSRSATPTRSPAATTPTSRPPLRPARDHARRPGPGRARPRPVPPPAPQGRGQGEGVVREAANVRNAILREAERADLVVMGASAQPAGTERRRVPVRRAAGGDRRPGEAVGRRRQDPRDDRPPDVRAARLAGRDARRRRSRRRGGPRRPGPGRALVRRGELPPRRVRRPPPPRPAQGEAGPDGLARPADARRGGDDRADRPAGDPRADGPRPARRRDPRHRLAVDRPDPRDRRGRGRPRRPAPRRPRRATARSGARARRSGSRSSRRAATSSSGPTRTSGTGTRGWSTGRSGRCSTSRGCST